MSGRSYLPAIIPMGDIPGVPAPIGVRIGDRVPIGTHIGLSPDPGIGLAAGIGECVVAAARLFVWGLAGISTAGMMDDLKKKAE